MKKLLELSEENNIKLNEDINHKISMLNNEEHILKLTNEIDYLYTEANKLNCHYNNCVQFDNIIKKINLIID